jgi:hypothetical protein
VAAALCDFSLNPLLYIPDTEEYRNLTDPPGQPICNLPLTAPDDEGPEITFLLADPNPAMVNTPVTLTATVDDAAKGGSNVKLAEWREGTGAWTAMSPVDVFDSPTEDATASPSSSTSAVQEVCVRGTDAYDNVGAEACVLLAVFDPTGGFATGAGWIDSPPGAYTPNDLGDPDYVGRAHFAFVSRYQPGATAPDGNASFRFRVADLDLKSTSYDWLVVNQGGTNAQFKGWATINDAGAPTGDDYRFMIWAGDHDPDTFRIKIWWEEDGVETVVYDNGYDDGMEQEIGAGNIKIHN